MTPPETTANIPIKSSLNERVKKLAASRSEQMGLSKPLSRVAWLELIVKQEEDKQ